MAHDQLFMIHDTTNKRAMRKCGNWVLEGIGTSRRTPYQKILKTCSVERKFGLQRLQQIAMYTQQNDWAGMPLSIWSSATSKSSDRAAVWSERTRPKPVYGSEPGWVEFASGSDFHGTVPPQESAQTQRGSILRFRAAFSGFRARFL